MALYTELTQEDLDRVAHEYGWAGPVRAVGVPEGSINTNYRLETQAGRLFLRHTTARSAEDLRFEAELLRHLAASAYPAPELLWTKAGEPFVELRGGRVSVFKHLAGEELGRAALTPAHLERLGAAVGKLHQICGSFAAERANPYSPDVVKGWLAELGRNEDPELRAIAQELEGGLAKSQRPRVGPIPRGVIHADIFLDNVKWLGDRVAAIFDFEMACRDALALDVAITLNAWCFDGGYRWELGAALLRGYEGERPLTGPERAHLLDYALFGAIRYTASRIRDFHLSPLPPERLFRKDFRTYLARARALAAMAPDELLRKLELSARVDAAR